MALVALILLILALVAAAIYAWVTPHRPPIIAVAVALTVIAVILLHASSFSMG